MNGSDADVPGDGKFLRILSLDGGGIRGYSRPRFWLVWKSISNIRSAAISISLRAPRRVASSPSGSVSGCPPATFSSSTWSRGRRSSTRSTVRWRTGSREGARHSAPVRHQALLRAAAPRARGVLGRRRLGESRTRLVIPAWHPVRARLHLQDGASSEARNRLQAAGDRRGDGHGRADVPQASRDGIRGRTRRRRRLG